MASNSYYLKQIQNRIYKVANEYGSHLYHDEDWSNVHRLFDIIRNIQGVNDIDYSSGTYYNYLSIKSDPTKPAYRDYKIKVSTDFGNLAGYVRCCAAGTMEDEFKYYDIVISIYPVKGETFEGKQIIISRKQLMEVMDSQKTQVIFTGNNANELGANAQEKFNDAKSAGLKSNSISLVGKTTTNNATDKDETVVGIDDNMVGTSNVGDAIKKTFQNAVNNGADPNKLTVQGNTEDITNGLGESKKFSKKQIEEARLKQMKSNGITMTKKQLRESITRYFIVDDGGVYNVFPEDEFDENGNYIEDRSVNIKDMDIVKTMYNLDAAFAYVDKLNDENNCY